MSEKKLTIEEIKAVKSVGFLHNRGTTMFSGRIITENGYITAEQNQVIAEAAQKYGDGRVALTSRLTFEIPGIEYDNIEAFREYIGKANLVTGGTGSRVRPIVGCKGTTCVFGLYDTAAVTAEVHERFYVGYYDVVLPHKFKIGLGSCPNNCIKPDLNDVGVVGQRVVKVELDKCQGCPTPCTVVESCPVAGVVEQSDDKMEFHAENCNNCGRCISKCPFGVIEEFEDKYKVYVGGKWGKQARPGSPLTKLFNEEEMLNVIEKSILLFKKDGISGERFGETVDRLGIQRVEKMLVSDNLLKNKEDILLIETVAGAHC